MRFLVTLSEAPNNGTGLSFKKIIELTTYHKLLTVYCEPATAVRQSWDTSSENGIPAAQTIRCWTASSALLKLVGDEIITGG